MNTSCRNTPQEGSNRSVASVNHDTDNAVVNPYIPQETLHANTSIFMSLNRVSKALFACMCKTNSVLEFISICDKH